METNQPTTLSPLTLIDSLIIGLEAAVKGTTTDPKVNLADRLDNAKELGDALNRQATAGVPTVFVLVNKSWEDASGQVHPAETIGVFTTKHDAEAWANTHLETEDDDDDSRAGDGGWEVEEYDLKGSDPEADKHSLRVGVCFCPECITDTEAGGMRETISQLAPADIVWISNEAYDGIQGEGIWQAVETELETQYDRLNDPDIQRRRLNHAIRQGDTTQTAAATQALARLIGKDEADNYYNYYNHKLKATIA